MQLFYDPDDLPHAKKLRDERFSWLEELGATRLDEAKSEDEGFLFGYQHGMEHLREFWPHVFQTLEIVQRSVRS